MEISEDEVTSRLSGLMENGLVAAVSVVEGNITHVQVHVSLRTDEMSAFARQKVHDQAVSTIGGALGRIRFRMVPLRK